jgi:3-hydroxybutyryl-CoA dehydrogenase
VTERLGIAGTGAVASGLIRLASERGAVVAWARSESSARAADAAHGEPVTVVTELDALAECTFVVESIVEELEAKRALLRALDAVLPPEAVVASTTSSLSIEELAAASDRPESFAGVHFFNPVEKMQLVELAFPAAASEDTRRRSRELCSALGKTAVEVPDAPGFVVNRLLFPYLFDAVRLLERHSLEPAAIDSCMKLGAGHPMGPLALLDMVGLDVAVSIARSLGERVPTRIEELIADGRLGRKSGAGFYDY